MPKLGVNNFAQRVNFFEENARENQANIATERRDMEAEIVFAYLVRRLLSQREMHQKKLRKLLKEATVRSLKKFEKQWNPNRYFKRRKFLDSWDFCKDLHCVLNGVTWDNYGASCEIQRDWHECFPDFIVALNQHPARGALPELIYQEWGDGFVVRFADR